LTPACDLVPEQKNDRGWKKYLGENIPFKAVRLFQSDTCEALDHATMNNHILLNIADSISAFSFTPSGSPTSNPVWEQMFSKEHGMFSAPDFEISVNRVAVQEGALQVHESSFCMFLNFVMNMPLIYCKDWVIPFLGLVWISKKDERFFRHE
jgi:hypothetical protein